MASGSALRIVLPLPEPGRLGTPTEAERAAEALRHDIVSGAWAPRTKLKMRELTERYGTGASPLREALSRLAAEGYVAQESQKGYRVPALSAADLDDITQSRQIIECEAFRLAIRHGGPDWEAAIVAGFHLLEQALRAAPAAQPGLDAAFETAHHAFHRALVSACPLPSLLGFSEHLYNQGSRYRHLMQRRIAPSEHVLAIHRRLRDLALARDADEAARELHAHIAIPARRLAEQLAGTTAPG